MKQKYLTYCAASLLVVIFGLMLFAFQVRQTELAVVTTFGQYTPSITNAGLYSRLPWPIQTIYRFDNRIQNFEPKFDQTQTKDAHALLITLFVGWQVANPQIFLERFAIANNDLSRAESQLQGMVRDVRNSVISRHPFSDLISTNRAQLKFDEIEKEMLTMLQPMAATNYGIHVAFLGIKQLALPESITSKVFDRMKAERQRLVKKFQTEGEAKAIEIRSDADRKRAEILSEAEAKATIIRGQGDAEAAKSYAVFEKNPELAVFLLQLKALESSLKERTTLILDQQTTPFNMLNRQSVELPNPSVKK
jgi:modulator of FtsH protease HflC